MPNYIKNILELKGSINLIDLCIKKHSTVTPSGLSFTHNKEQVICSKDGNFIGWFNLNKGIFTYLKDKSQVSGLPEGVELNIDERKIVFPDFRKIVSPPDDPAYRDEPSQKVAEISPNWWYTWNIENWGTKWNLMDPESISINKFSFETAWSGVPDLMRKLSEMNPGLKIVYTFADEDTGYNTGCYIFNSGKEEFKNIPEGGSPEAYEMAFYCRPERRNDYIIQGGEYIYKEEEI